MIFGSKGEKFIASTGNENAVPADMFPDAKLGEHVVLKAMLIKSFEKIHIYTDEMLKATYNNSSNESLIEDVIKKEKYPIDHIWFVDLNQITNILVNEPGPQIATI